LSQLLRISQTILQQKLQGVIDKSIRAIAELYVKAHSNVFVSQAKGYEMSKSSEITLQSLAVIFAAMVSAMTSSFILVGVALSVFMGTISHDYGWSRAEIGGAYTSLAIGMSLGCLFFGRLVDQFGPRKVLLPLLFAGGLLISLFPFIGKHLVLFYVAHFVLGLSTTGAVAYSKLISTWFFHMRAIALTALGFGCFVSYVLSPFAVRSLGNILGWRNVYFVFGAVTIFVTFPVLYFFFKERKVSQEEYEVNRSHEVVPDGASKINLSEALRARTYWIVLLAQVGGTFVYSGFYAHSIGIMGEHGVLRDHAVSGLSLLSFGGLIAQLMTGILLDKYNTPRVILPFTIVSFLCMLALFFAHGELPVLSLVFLFGVSCGGQTSMTSYFTSRYFGVRNFATIYGSMMPLMLVVTAPAAVIFGACFDHFRSYNAAIVLAFAALFTSIVFFAKLEPYPYPRKLAIVNKESEEQLKDSVFEVVAG